MSERVVASAHVTGFASLGPARTSEVLGDLSEAGLWVVPVFIDQPEITYLIPTRGTEGPLVTSPDIEWSAMVGGLENVIARLHTGLHRAGVEGHLLDRGPAYLLEALEALDRKRYDHEFGRYSTASAYLGTGKTLDLLRIAVAHKRAQVEADRVAKELANS
jgi:hypothetical protein